MDRSLNELISNTSSASEEGAIISEDPYSGKAAASSAAGATPPSAASTSNSSTGASEARHKSDEGKTEAAAVTPVVEYKVVLVGDGGVGKTSLLKSLKKREFQENYIATVGAEVFTLPFSTNYGRIVLNIWDCGGQEGHEGLRSGYYISATAAIVMFGVTSRITFHNWRGHQRAVLAALDTYSQIAIVGNKNEEPEHKVDSEIIAAKLSEEERRRYFPVSAKTGAGCEAPFAYLLREVTGRGDLRLVAEEDLPDEDALSCLVPLLRHPSTSRQIS